MKCHLSYQFTLVLLIILICHAPIVNWGLYVNPRPFSTNLTMKNIKKRRWYVRVLLLATILAQWWQPVASNIALDLFHRPMHVVTYQRIAMAIKLASKVGVCFIVIFLYVTPAAAGTIHSRYLPNCSILWLLPKPWTSSIGQCTGYCHGASAGPSKRLVK